MRLLNSANILLFERIRARGGSRPGDRARGIARARIEPRGRPLPRHLIADGRLDRSNAMPDGDHARPK